MAATIKDIARESGVSTATVSYVLNNGPRNVEPQTRARVLTAMKRLHYHPSTVARGLARKRLDTLGVVLGNPEPNLVTNPYYSAVLDGIIRAATALKQNVTLYTGLEWQGEAESLPAFLDRRVDGLLLMHPNEEMVEALANTQMQCVLINRTTGNARVTSVDIDNRAAAAEAVAHLLHLGHRRIGVVGGHSHSIDQSARVEGYRAALDAAGIAFDAALVRNGYFHPDWGREGMRQMLSLSEKPTAIFCGNDLIAAGVYQTAEENGLRIPDDLSVVGFDDTMPSTHLRPPLTTVHQPLGEIGSTATRLLVEKISAASPESVEVKKIILPTELIVRGSTGQVPV